MFIDNNRTPNDLFNTINKANIDNIFFTLGKDYNIIDRKWCGVFSYIPFCQFHWTEVKGVPTKSDNMFNLIKEWKEFLIEHNYDKKQEK